eukprot:scaffold68108_cov56-Phaeocystis_antarctica.AAC.3
MAPRSSIMRLTALVAVLLPHAAALAVRPKLAALRPGPNLPPPSRVDVAEPPGPRDVVIKLYDISTPELCAAMSRSSPMWPGCQRGPNG